jgi:TetR/AcrR family acrAB operon transcriptional repressor
MDDMQHLLQIAQQLGHIKADAHLRNTTIGLFALVGGIKYNWLLDPEAFDLEAVGLATLDAYLAGLKASPVV